MKKTKSSPKKTKSQVNKPTLVAFLLDRTGSMESCKDETIKGFNGYIDELVKKDGGEMKFTMTQFDSQSIDVIHNSVALANVKRLTDKTYNPRGSTNLYDAMGKTIRETESASREFKVLFVVLTDGQENASSEWNESTIKTLIKDKEDKDNWTFAYIGVNPLGWSAVQDIARSTAGAANVLNIDRKDTVRSYGKLAAQSVAYACSTAGNHGTMMGFWSGKTSNTGKTITDEPEEEAT